MLCEEGDSELSLMPPHLETLGELARLGLSACDSLALNGDEGACLPRLF